MFKIIDNPEFTHDVTVKLPADDGYAAMTLRTRFRLIPASEFEAFQKMPGLEGADAFFDRTVVDFVNLEDASENPVQCTPDLRERILSYGNVRIALVQHYMRAANGAALGN